MAEAVSDEGWYLARVPAMKRLLDRRLSEALRELQVGMTG